MEKEEKKVENDIAEDAREERESIKDEEEQKGNENKNSDDIAEDAREESESIEDLKKLIAEKDVEIERLKKDLDEAHKVFMNAERKSEEPKRDFNNLTKSYQ